jgi:hypothetical protein
MRRRSPAWTRYGQGVADRFVCPCCGYRTLSEQGTYEICTVCWWEDDPDEDPELQIAGPNGMALAEARRNFETYGAMSEQMRKLARDPLPEEMPRADIS